MNKYTEITLAIHKKSSTVNVIDENIGISSYVLKVLSDKISS